MMLNKLWFSRTVVPRSCRKFKRFSSTLGGRLTISPEVTRALKTGKPVVALESTIITHGMPYPENYLTAHELEEIIRSLDCIPATVAIVGGHIHVGITKYLMDDLASMKTPAYKTSRRDLPYVISKGLYGGTTVSATMIAAKMAGINVFVTGGIGGVHRGASSTMDISADLTELGRTPVAVVSSGVKSILDVGKTLEYLETQGVCVATFGARREFPSFFSPQAIGDDGKPLLSPYNVSTAREAAELIHANLTLELKSGVLIAVPPPPEGVVAEEMADVESIIQETLKEVKEKGIRGKDVTPYVLREVAAKTDGKSLTANIALVQNNAMVGAQIAKELQEIINTKKESVPQENRLYRSNEAREEERRSKKMERLNQPVIIGGSVVDSTLTIQEDFIKMDGRTHAASAVQSFGGVGRNVADALGRLMPSGHPSPLFISVVGNDSPGKSLLSNLKHLDTTGFLISSEESTASYTALLDQKGECLMGIGDMAAHMLITEEHVSKFLPTLKRCPLLIVDGNIPQETMDYVIRESKQMGIPVWFEPTDVKKATKAFKNGDIIDFASPNLNELRAITGTEGTVRNSMNGDSDSTRVILQEAYELSHIAMDMVNTLFVTLGKLGVMVTSKGCINDPLIKCGSTEHPTTRLYSPPFISTFISVSGAGDCFAAGVLAGMLRGLPESQCVAAGTAAAAMSIASHPTVPQEMKASSIMWDSTAKYQSYSHDV